MKKLKITFFWLLAAILLVGCQPENLNSGIQLNPNNQNSFSSGPTCDGKPIMKFGSLDEIQNTHRDLYNEYSITQDGKH